LLPVVGDLRLKSNARLGSISRIRPGHNKQTQAEVHRSEMIRKSHHSRGVLGLNDQLKVVRSVITCWQFKV
jgi:hypothetical protein